MSHEDGAYQLRCAHNFNLKIFHLRLNRVSIVREVKQFTSKQKKKRKQNSYNGCVQGHYSRFTWLGIVQIVAQKEGKTIGKLHHCASG